MSLRVWVLPCEGNVLGATRCTSWPAGFESWRWEVWGSPAARALGLVLLPCLKHDDLQIRGEGLAGLEVEVWQVMRNLSFLERRTRYDGAYILARVQNIGEAVAMAIAGSGTVWIS